MIMSPILTCRFDSRSLNIFIVLNICILIIPGQTTIYVPVVMDRVLKGGRHKLRVMYLIELRDEFNFWKVYTDIFYSQRNFYA